MPWHIRKLSKPVKNFKNQLCKYEIIKDDDGKVVGRCSSEQTAKKMLAALNINAR